jgi:hypothetical protein
MREHKLPQSFWLPLSLSINRVFPDQQQWLSYLQQLKSLQEANPRAAETTENRPGSQI